MQNEIHPAVEANNVNTRREQENAKRLNAVVRKQKTRKATRALLLRVVIAAVLVAAALVAESFGLIAWQIVIPINCASMVWVAIWFGAWMQFMFAKEGLMK